MVSYENQWLKIKETDRSDSFCTIAVDLSEPLIVPDASLDPRFKENKLVKNDKLIEGIVNECAGFKIIHSYPFETIISYMISANNNVKHIQKSVNLLSEKYGKKVHFNDCDY